MMQAKIKIIDIDVLFDKYISDYVYSNIGKVKPEEIENQMPILYTEFGDKPLKELDGKTPNSYYRDFSAKDLVECLKTHLKTGVAVSDFLCEALTDADGVEDVLTQELINDNDEEYVLYLMNILNEKNSSKPVKRYLEFVLWDYSETIRELATEILGGFADLCKEEILASFKDASIEKKACLVDILSHASKDDRIFDILIEEFVKHPDNIPLYAGYLGKYGDERALPFLLTLAESDKINYMDFEELRFAIEMLGGECNIKRDFSADKTYKKIVGAKKRR